MLFEFIYLDIDRDFDKPQVLTRIIAADNLDDATRLYILDDRHDKHLVFDILDCVYIVTEVEPQIRQRLKTIKDSLNLTYDEGDPSDYPKEVYDQFLYDHMENIIEILKETGKPDGIMKVSRVDTYKFYIKTDVEILIGPLIKAAGNIR